MLVAAAAAQDYSGGGGGGSHEDAWGRRPPPAQYCPQCNWVGCIGLVAALGLARNKAAPFIHVLRELWSQEEKSA